MTASEIAMDQNQIANSVDDMAARGDVRGPYDRIDTAMHRVIDGILKQEPRTVQYPAEGRKPSIPARLGPGGRTVKILIEGRSGLLNGNMEPLSMSSDPCPLAA
jgi:hypothetical protein